MAAASSFGKEQEIPVGPVAGTRDALISLSAQIDSSKGEQGSVLASDADVDHQLLIFISFMEAVKIRGVCFTTTAASTDAKSSGPKNVKLFVNSTNLDFDGAASQPPTQAFAITAAQLSGAELLTTFVKFQNVQSLAIFVETNQKNSPVTVLNGLQFIGTPIAGFNVAAIKKVDDH